ncbi:MAG: GNAT family N-acetyltransferase, partial [Hyphomicrobiaceae bacterium]|nr:GNAT family N-acetyltransferase [Hyphomicrobiaceae bacterium]
EMLFAWQLQPETRRFARNPEPPTWDGHVAWLAGKLADPRCLFNIVVEDGVPVGFVRLDVVPAAAGYAEAFEISIAISSERAGGGLGLAALRLARRLVPDAEIQAVVLPANAASLALFKKAGYMPCGENRFVVTPG